MSKKTKPAARAALKATPPARQPVTSPPSPATTSTPRDTSAARTSATPPAPEPPAAKRPSARPRTIESEGEPRDLGRLIRVRATRVGFIDNVRRREGDVFDVHEAEYTDKWMEPVDGHTRTSITGPAEALKRVHDEAVAGKLKTPSGKSSASDPLGTER